MTTYQWKQYDKYKSLNETVGEYYETVHQCLALAIDSMLIARCDTGLDIACGHGESTRLLSRFADSVVGVDSSEELIGIAQQQELGDKFNFLCSTFEDFALPEQKFDIVTAAWYLNHVHTEEQLENVIQKIRQILKPGGTIAMVVPGDAFTSRRTQIIGQQSFGWKQAWYEEAPEFTRGVFAYGDEWIPTTVWQPTHLMRLLGRYFDIRSWDVKGTIVAENRLTGLEVEPPFEVLYGQLRQGAN